MNQLGNAIRHYGPLAARILLAQLFIVSGCGKIAGFANTAAFMAGMGLPLSNVLLTLTIALEVGGGVLLIAGWQARWVATAFIGFTFLTALIFRRSILTPRPLSTSGEGRLEIPFSWGRRAWDEGWAFIGGQSLFLGSFIRAACASIHCDG